MGSPSSIDEKQLKELNLKIDKKLVLSFLS